MSITETAPLPLSAAFKQGSQELHNETEASTFIEELMGGKLNLFGYINYLKALRVIYASLEEVSREHADDPIVAKMHDVRLERLAAIDADIAELSTGAPEESLCQHEAAAGYAARIREAAAIAPERLVAHHYTRYLGDLSGGLAIGRIMARHFNLTSGLAYYDFEDIKAKVYKDQYRENLDNLPLTEQQRAEAVEEVQEAFRWNQRVFTELGQDLAAYRL